MTFRFMIYSDESETLGGLLACANKYAAADDDNREDGETCRRESGTLAKAAQVTRTGITKSRQATDQPDRQW